MEKLLYVVWKPQQQSTGQFKQHLLKTLAPALIEAGAKKLAVSVDDERVAPALEKRMVAHQPAMSGLVSLWLDSHLQREPCETLIAECCEQLAGYLVSESVPIVNNSHRVPLGEASPGMSQVSFLQVPERLSYDEWQQIWQESHTRVAVDTQANYQYIQNLVVRPLTAEAPHWSAIVEEGFEAPAMTDLAAFYDAVDDPEKLALHQQQMMDSVFRFIDMENINVIPMSEYRLQE